MKKSKKKKFNKKTLIRVSRRIEANDFLTPDEASVLLDFEKQEKETKIWDVLKKLGLPLSIMFGLFIVIFPEVVESIITILPNWLELNPRIAIGLDYIWGIIGSPIEKTHLIYHMPNILLYSFGVLEIRNLINLIKKRSWLDRVINAKTKLETLIKTGEAKWDLVKGHSILFVGKGDFIGEEIARGTKNESLVLASNKPAYTNIWDKYELESSYESLKVALENSGASDAGEYVFFPVKDNEVFLPSETAYDIAPHKLDLLVQNLRSVESENNWTSKRVIIVGDKFHQSVIETAGKNGGIKEAKETITLKIISMRHFNVTLIDPTDLVLKKVLEISKGRRILFRASQEGLSEYKQRFYERLEDLGYKEKSTEEETLTIGYDIFEDQTEQQSISNRSQSYMPVVLSRDVYDSLLQNGYRKEQIIYVPSLVVEEIKTEIQEQ